MKKIIFWVFIVLFVLFVAAILWRVFEMDAKSIFSDITPSEAAKRAYGSGEKILTHDVDQPMSFDGYMQVYSFVYIPEERELQIMVKHNQSVYEKLGASSEAGFAFKLYNTETEEEYTDYTASRDMEGRYRYYRLLFSGVEFSDEADIELVMYPSGNDESHSALKLHKSGEEFYDYKMSKKEIESLGG
ncbi:MAG: hypothetical protein IKN38_06510 [Clostridia bacterium]|nr:hypothetical protein [Clostridia bacterium]